MKTSERCRCRRERVHAALILAIGVSLSGPAFAWDVRDDAIFRVTFDNNSAVDVTSGNVSAPLVETDVGFTTTLPAMANSSGAAAVFNGSTSFISYGLGASEELKQESALTYHCRAKFDGAMWEVLTGEQWLMGRFRSVDQGTSTRVTVLSSNPGVARFFGGASADGNAWVGGLQNVSGVQAEVFYDVFLRFEPGVAVRVDVFNAETGERLGSPMTAAVAVNRLRDTNSPLDVGNRTMASTVPFAGVMEQINIWDRVLRDDEIEAMSTDDGFVQLAPMLALIQQLEPADGATFLPSTARIRFVAESVAGIERDAIQLVLNGQDRSSDLVITGNVNRWEVTFPQLPANLQHVAEISVSDVEGRTRSETLRFDTFGQGVVYVEAEDYNFAGGQYINTPVLSSVPGPNNYLDRFSVQGIDRNAVGEPGRTEYRIGDGVGTSYSDDFPLRQHFQDARQTDPGIEDYYVGWFGDGAWLNYTRVFPTGNYRIYSRVAATAPFVARFDRVAGSTSAGQTTFPIGHVIGPATGGGQIYAFRPVVDALGAPVVVALGGETTIRFTTLTGSSGLNANYFMVAPVAEAVVPYLAEVMPVDGALAVDPDTAIEAVICRRPEQMGEATVMLRVNGEDVTSAASIVETVEGLRIRYAVAGGFTAGGTQRVELHYSDTAVPPNVLQHAWRFTVRRAITGDTPEIFEDTVFRVTFDGNNTGDRTLGNVSLAEVEQDIGYTTELPPMPNSTGTGAVFNGSTSFISYGLGANQELKQESALTYHCRVKLGEAQFAVGEQWFMGRFRSVDQGNNTRVTAVSSFAGPRRFFGGVSAVGTGWTPDLQYVHGPQPEVFYDVFLRFMPGVAVRFDVFDAETGLRLGTSQMAEVSAENLLDANSPFDVGNRTMASTVPFAGVMEQMNVWNRVLSDWEIHAIAYGPDLPIPGEPTITGIQVVDGINVEITFTVPDIGRLSRIEWTGTIGGDTAWETAVDAVFAEPEGNVISARLPLPGSSPTFYRVALE